MLSSATFRELRTREVRRIYLLRTPVNKLGERSPDYSFAKESRCPASSPGAAKNGRWPVAIETTFSQGKSVYIFS